MGDLAQSRLALVFGRWHMLTHLSLWEFARRLIKCRLPVFLKSEERLSCGFSTGFRTDVSLQGSWDTIFDNVSFSFLPIFFKNPGGVNFTRKKINRCQHSFFVTALLIGLSQCFYDRTFFFFWNGAVACFVEVRCTVQISGKRWNKCLRRRLHEVAGPVGQALLIAGLPFYDRMLGVFVYMFDCTVTK